MKITIAKPVRAGFLGAGILAAAVGVAACGQSSSATASSPAAPAQPVAQVSASTQASPSTCPTPAAAALARRSVAEAKSRYALEASGATIHADLGQIAHNTAFVKALRAGNTSLALEIANRELVRHVVRIRVLQGSHVVLDANPTSFDVNGSSLTLRSGGRTLGQLKITVQDIIGFIKLDRRLYHIQTVVRSANGQMRTSLLAATRAPLPSSGCVQVGRRAYVVSTFPEQSFTGEPLTVWVLSPA